MNSPGFSLKRLVRLRELLERQVDSGLVPGALVVRARHGQVHIESTGTLAFEGAGSMTSMAGDTICRMASMTKPIVAACAMTLVEDCTLRLFGQALRERVCEPLGMKDTAFSVSADNLDRFAAAYERGNSPAGAATVADDGLWNVPPVFESGGGGLVSTDNDYLAFVSALLAGGTYQGARVPSRPSVTLMTSDQLIPLQRAASGFWPGTSTQ